MKLDLTKPLALNQQICFALYRANKEYARLYADQLAQFNLTYPQFLVLSSLWHTGEPMTMKELEKILSLDSGTLTPLLKRLEQRGWITREKSKEDTRHVIITLTDDAIAQKDQVMSTAHSCVTKLDISPEDYQNRVDEINDIAVRLQKILSLG